MAKYEDFKKSQESRLLLTTALQTTTFSYWDTVPSLYILRLNKYLKISNSWIGFGSNSMIANYSIRSEILNISHSTKQDTCQMRPEVAELLLSESENPEWCVHVFVSLCVGVSVCVCVRAYVCLSVCRCHWLDDGEDDYFEDGDLYCRLEEIRVHLEEKLGLELLMKAYEAVQVSLVL